MVDDYKTNKHCKGFDSWSHLISMLFCQFAKSQSVRNISNGLRSATGNLNHLGHVKAPSKSTLSYQNRHRSWKLFQDFYYVLLKQLNTTKGTKRSAFRIKSKIFLLDSTTISLCLSLFDWAKYKTQKGAIQMHTLLDYDGHLPAYVNITDGKTADNKGAHDIPLHKLSVIVADRFYNDFPLLNVWDSNWVKFVIRFKDNLQFKVVRELDLPETRDQHILKDEIIELKSIASRKKYPKKLRRIAIWDEKNKHTVELIANQTSRTANTISELYKARWDIEIFFREIKQLLHIKSFIGISRNSVMVQIWTALITILILKWLKEKGKIQLVSFKYGRFYKIELISEN